MQFKFSQICGMASGGFPAKAIGRNLVRFPSQAPVLGKLPQRDMQWRLAVLYFVRGWSIRDIAWSTWAIYRTSPRTMVPFRIVPFRGIRESSRHHGQAIGGPLLSPLRYNCC